ncbi:AAA family ATPase [Rubrivivax sp. RP6-9]|uniref:AAA family ATPase n=1 Tax=Rubrivivax sp. RP6-9 TaxID=3415750 RepID=UPI003CC6B6C9
MYAPFFGLQREPFSIAPDPHFLFMSEAHREALAHLLYGLSGGGGFVLLTGEIGAGKTTVCRCFLDQVPADCNVAYVFNPKLSVVELLQTVCDEFRIAVPAGAATVKDFVDPLNRFLLAAHAAGRHSVLVIDEAQSLSADLLEQLRLLTNLETAERKLLQIILIGQPELREMLARPELEQLAQRVTARYHLPALSEAESAAYVRHRLSVAGGKGELPFDRAALRRLHQLCRGVPRRINLLAGRAMLGGYASGKTRIGRAVVERAAEEVFAPRQDGRTRRREAVLMGVAAAGLAVAVGGAAWSLWLRPVAPRAAAAAAPAASGALQADAAASGAAGRAASAAPLQPGGDGPALADAGSVLAQAWRSDAAAWRALGARWGLDLPAGDADPCDAAARQQVPCFRGVAGLAQVRELARPGVLTLRDAQNRASHVLLTALHDDSATLEGAGSPQTVSLATLAALWRGEFATFWRAPPGWREGEPAGAALAAWLDPRLPPVPGQPLSVRVMAFQVANGLKPDGLAGPMTLMQINRASGVDEPRLATSR